MKPPSPLTKMEMIERSLRCFVLGLIGLLPVIGLPMAVASLRHYRRVKRGRGDRWNPAERYWFWGGICARLSVVVFGLIPLTIGTIIGLMACWS